MEGTFIYDKAQEKFTWENKVIDKLTTIKLPIRDWYYMLPHPINQEALNNLVNTDRNRLDWLEISLLDAIGTGFNWKNSKQGYLYWDGIYKDILNNKIKLSK